jgi:hypothetical protein
MEGAYKSEIAVLAAMVTVALLSSVAIHGLIAPGGNTAAAAPEKKHPGIKLQPDSGPPGSRVTITGSEFKAKSTVKITFDGKTLKTEDTKVTTDANGSFTAHVTIPDNAKDGNHKIKASAGFFNSDTATFTVKRSS